MNKNGSAITMSKALKLYNGRSMGEMMLKTSLFSIGSYAATLLLFVLMGAVSSGGFDAARNDIGESMVSDTILVIDTAIINLILSQLTFEKHMPGGKFFRTVNGGFDTYRKASSAVCISRIVNIAVTAATAGLLHISGIMKLKYGMASVITAIIFLVLAIGICNLISMIFNSTLSAFLSTAVFSVIGITAIIILRENGGRLGAVQLIAAAAAAVLVPVSQIMLMKVYKEKRWKS